MNVLRWFGGSKHHLKEAPAALESLMAMVKFLGQQEATIGVPGPTD